jgi:ABC-type Fe3+/spermidine/putrescine transport system ATPase subunit
MSAVIETSGLGKRYGRRWALRECTLAIPEGRVVGLVGPNGAGKTTLLHLAVGLLAPTSGAIAVLGGRPGGGPAQLGRVGFVAQDTPVYPRLSVAGQFLDIGTGIPTAGNVHQVAAQTAAGTRVVYVDNDPIVHVHANALLTGSGTTRIVLADLREPEAILGHPKVGELIDFTQPVALLLVAILHFIDGENPARIVATLRDALPPGSYLALSHATADFRPDAAHKAAAVYNQATSTATLRSHAQIAALFEGWELIDPGLVQVPLWRPEGKPPRPKELSKIWIYGGIGRRSM